VRSLELAVEWIIYAFRDSKQYELMSKFFINLNAPKPLAFIEAGQQMSLIEIIRIQQYA